MERFGDQGFADLGTVRVCRVDKVDAALDDASQQRDSGTAIGWITPNARSGNPHGAEAEAFHDEIAADGDRRAVV